MAEWTSEAQDYLDGYLRQVSALARGQGDDADDIVAGLREHIANEVEAEAGTLVTLDALRKTIAAVGTPEQVVSPDFSLSAATERARQAKPIGVAHPEPRHRHSGCAIAALIALVVTVLAAIAVPLLLLGLTFVSYRAVEVVPATEVDPHTGYEMAVIDKMKAIATAEQDFRRNDALDADGDGTSDYGTLQELDAVTPLGLETNERGEFLLDGYLFRVHVTPSGDPGGPAFLCSVRPPFEEIAVKQWAEIDQTGEIRMTEPPIAAVESEGNDG